MFKLRLPLTGFSVLAAGLLWADAGPVATHLTSPGDQHIGRVFTVRVEAFLQNGAGQWSYTLNGTPTADPVETPNWDIQGNFQPSGPLQAVGTPSGQRNGDRYFVQQGFRCSAAGAARVGFDGSIAYQVVAGGAAGGGVLRFGNIPFTESGTSFNCLAGAGSAPTPVTMPPAAASVGHCDPATLNTEYGTFVGRIWREPGTDPMPIGSTMVIHSEVDNTFRSDRFEGSSWDLSGDLWEWAGVGVTPRHAENGHHPWLYVGTPALPYKGQATFTCARADVVGLVHLIKIRWPDPDHVTGPMREATLTCYVPPFKCAGEGRH